MTVNFGTLLEIIEDWIRNDLNNNRILARIVDGEDIVEAVRRTDQEALFDDKGVHLNDESPQGIYRDLKQLEENDVDYATPIEIEIWFSDGEDDIQYRLPCHQYFVNQDKLAVMHFLGRDEDEFEDEFKSFLHEQY